MALGVQRVLSKGISLGALVMAVTVWFPDQSVDYSVTQKVIICVISFLVAFAAGQWYDRAEKKIEQRRWEELDGSRDRR